MLSSNRKNNSSKSSELECSVLSGLLGDDPKKTPRVIADKMQKTAGAESEPVPVLSSDGTVRMKRQIGLTGGISLIVGTMSVDFEIIIFRKARFYFSFFVGLGLESLSPLPVCWKKRNQWQRA